MLVKVCEYIFNTNNISVIREIDDDVFEVYFLEGYAERVILQIQKNELVKILGVIENG